MIWNIKSQECEKLQNERQRSKIIHFERKRPDEKYCSWIHYRYVPAGVLCGDQSSRQASISEDLAKNRYIAYHVINRTDSDRTGPILAHS